MVYVYYSFKKGFLHVCKSLLDSFFSYSVQISLLGALEDVFNQESSAYQWTVSVVVVRRY